MKKVIYGALFLAIVGIGFTSCEKAESFSPVNENQVKPLAKEVAGLRIYYDNGNHPGVEGVDYGCKGSGGNCLDDIIVIKDQSKYIIKGINTANSNGTITTYFTNNSTELADILSQEAVDGIINGNLNLDIRGDINSGSKGYLLFYNNSNHLEFVIPVKA